MHGRYAGVGGSSQRHAHCVHGERAHFGHLEHAEHSPIFDMESFFWVLLYTILHRNKNVLSEKERDIYKGILPERFNGSLYGDVCSKTVIMHRWLEFLIDYNIDAPNLASYEGLIRSLAVLVNKYSKLAEKRYMASRRAKFVTKGEFSREEEETAILEYINAFETFLYSGRSNNDGEGSVECNVI